MAFDWFRRQHSQPQEKTTTEAEPRSPDEPVRPAESETTESAAASTTAASTGPDEDYLAWAKAAYKNVKKQTAEPVADAQVQDEKSPEPEDQLEAAQAVEPATDQPANTLASPEPESMVPVVTTSQEVAPPAEPLASAEDPALETVETSSLTPLQTAPADSSSSMSFLERAQLEREARLERLNATAIEEPEVEEIENTAAGSETTLAFDDDFLWTAEVLAMQGRRPEEISIEEITWLKRLRQGLGKTRRNLVNQLKAIVGQGPLNQDAVLEIETLLLQADVGVEATDYIIEALQSKLREEALPPDQAIAYLKSILRDMLDRPLKEAETPVLAPEHDTLNLWLITGVNGAGKTTTIGKLAHLGNKSGYRCLIAAADTFRAAAVQQVQAWGDRSEVEVIANPGQNTDPAAVVFDAITAAEARNTELLLIDTAGRLQNKKNLMAELNKIRRIIDKKAADARIESLLVLDATLGQNGIRQAQIFAEAAQLSGVVLTKLDGTAKGGVALAVVQQLNLPIRFIGAGEGITDLRPFSSYEFIEALLNG